MCNREIKFGAFYRYAKAQGADAIATGHYRSGEKDQSYFLALVPKTTLEATIFPVGAMAKSDVRTLAKKFGLPVAEKKDSQGVCFLGSVSVKEFLTRELGADVSVLHTIGERVDGKYVVGKEHGTLRLADAPASSASPIRFSSANWLLDPSLATEAQTRYRAPRIKGRVVGSSFVPIGRYSEPPAPGQLIALYQESALAGGAIIDAYAS
jgi:tRNA U34 2-thiouridine synthase MnmA/TrmU